MSHYTQIVKNNGMTGNFATVQAAIGGALADVDALAGPALSAIPARVIDRLAAVHVSGLEGAAMVNLVWTQLPATPGHPVDLAAIVEASIEAQVIGSSVVHNGAPLPSALTPVNMGALALALGLV